MITDDQAWSFTAKLAPVLPVLINSVDKRQVYYIMVHYDEECQTWPNISCYGVLWPAMIKNDQTCCGTSNMANSTAV